MKHSVRILLALALGVGLLATNGYAAEEKPSPAKTFTTADMEAAWQRRVPEINLGDNLPLSEVARACLDRHFPEVNFLMPGMARGQAVPHAVLRNVTLEELLRAIELISEGQLRVNRLGVPMELDPNGFLLTSPGSGPIPHSNLVSFVCVLPAQPPAERKPVAICRVFSLELYLANRDKEGAEESARAIRSLYEALEVAWKMLHQQDRSTATPTLTIHEGTKLLIAVGHERELSVMEQVIKELLRFEPAQRIATPAKNEPKPNAANASPLPATPPAKP